MIEFFKFLLYNLKYLSHFLFINVQDFFFLILIIQHIYILINTTHPTK